MTLTENLNLCSAVRTFYIAVILYDSKYRNLHHLCHVVSFLNDHLNKILRRTYDHDSVDRKGLEYSKRYITGSRRHIYKEIVYFIPDNIGPELFYHICKDRSSPDNRSVFCWKKKVNGHNLNPICGFHRIDSVIICLCSTGQSIHLRDRRSCDICIQDTYFIAFCCHCVSERSCHKGFTYAAFTADNTDHMFYI